MRSVFSLALMGLLLVTIVVVPATAQRNTHIDRGADQPHHDIEVLEDGSVSANGFWYQDIQAWQDSDQFKDGGHRCASQLTANLSNPPLWDKAAADCSMSSTTIQSAFNPGSGSVLTIPVVFHIISKTDGTGNIADSFVNSQIAVLNEDFRALSGTPGAPGNDTKIQFVLASTDPSGNATTGINRVTSNAYFTDPGPGVFNDMKQALNWDTTDYLNIYTNDSAGFLGYATFPATDAGTIQDGVVLLHSSVGRNSPGGIYNQGRTGTHEVGHYLGLFHVFQGGCGSASSPYTTGDLIADTNAQSGQVFNCPTSSSSCGSSNPIRNYMNYTQDTCMWEFSSEQANRMRCSLDAYRSGLVDGTHGGSGGPSSCHTGSNGDWSYCSSSCPCDDGEGDCDSDSECSSGTTCVSNVGANYGWASSVDVCETSSGGGGPDSCVGNCGGQASGGCWCDSSCSFWGDCCSDKVAICG